MSADIDCELIRQVILDAIGSYDSIHEARINGVRLMAARDRAIELALPMGPKVAQQYANKMPPNTRVELADIEQASRQGILEGIDRYQPRKLFQTKTDIKSGRAGKPVQVSTYLHLWVRKRVLEEIAGTHWRITKPPRKVMESYFKDELSEGERHEYANLVLSGVCDVEYYESAEWQDEDAHFAEQARQAML